MGRTEGRLTDIYKTRAEKVMFVKGMMTFLLPMWPMSSTLPMRQVWIRSA